MYVDEKQCIKLEIKKNKSGGEIVLIQHLVSSLSVSDRTVHMLREKEF